MFPLDGSFFFPWQKCEQTNTLCVLRHFHSEPPPPPEACRTSTGRSLSLLSDCRLINSPLNREYVIRFGAVPWHLSQRTGSSLREKPKAGILHILPRDIWKRTRGRHVCLECVGKRPQSLFFPCNTFHLLLSNSSTWDSLATYSVLWSKHLYLRNSSDRIYFIKGVCCFVIL